MAVLYDQLVMQLYIAFWSRKAVIDVCVCVLFLCVFFLRTYMIRTMLVNYTRIFALVLFLHKL